MNKDKCLTLTVSAIVVVIAICTAVGGGYLINKYQDDIKKFDKKEVKTEIKTTTPTIVKVSGDKAAASEFQTYMKNIQVKIKSNWEPDKTADKSASVVMSYKIDKNGNLKSFQILKSSGSQQLDDSAVKALKKSAPFEPLPKSYSGDDIDVQFTFDYNVVEQNTKSK